MSQSYYARLSPEKKAALIARVTARNKANPERRREISRLSAARRRATMDPALRKEQSRIASAARVVKTMAWRKANPDRAKEAERKYRAAHPFESWSEERKAAAVAKASAWAKANRERYRELLRNAARRRIAANPEAERERLRRLARRYEAKRSPEERARKWKSWAEKNRARLAERSRIRAFLVQQATPPWADRKAILYFYGEAARLTRETGIEYQVDHIVPLRGKKVCGLHVQDNLQVITKIANMAKGNRTAEVL